MRRRQLQAMTAAHAKRIAHKAARQMGACYITDLSAERTKEIKEN